MAVEYPFGFIVGNTDPIDSRFVFATIAARDALSEYNRYIGLTTYVQEDETFYYLKGGITNAHWTVQSSSFVPTLNIGDPEVDGSWRMVLVPGGLEIQVRISGTWTKRGFWGQA